MLPMKNGSCTFAKGALAGMNFYRLVKGMKDSAKGSETRPGSSQPSASPSEEAKTDPSVSPLLEAAVQSLERVLNEPTASPGPSGTLGGPDPVAPASKALQEPADQRQRGTAPEPVSGAYRVDVRTSMDLSRAKASETEGTLPWSSLGTGCVLPSLRRSTGAAQTPWASESCSLGEPMRLMGEAGPYLELPGLVGPGPRYEGPGLVADFQVDPAQWKRRTTQPIGPAGISKEKPPHSAAPSEAGRSQSGATPAAQKPRGTTAFQVDAKKQRCIPPAHSDPLSTHHSQVRRPSPGTDTKKQQTKQTPTPGVAKQAFVKPPSATPGASARPAGKQPRESIPSEETLGEQTPSGPDCPNAHEVSPLPLPNTQIPATKQKDRAPVQHPSERQDDAYQKEADFPGAGERLGQAHPGLVNLLAILGLLLGLAGLTALLRELLYWF
jgi:hypothetical protein